MWHPIDCQEAETKREWNWAVTLHSCPVNLLPPSRLHFSKWCQCLGTNVQTDESMGKWHTETVQHPTWKLVLVWGWMTLILVVSTFEPNVKIESVSLSVGGLICNQVSCIFFFFILEKCHSRAYFLFQYCEDTIFMKLFYLVGRAHCGLYHYCLYHLIVFTIIVICIISYYVILPVNCSVLAKCYHTVYH